MSDKLTNMAQRIAANACAALQEVRDGHPFPTAAYEQITRDSALIRLEDAETKFKAEEAVHA